MSFCVDNQIRYCFIWVKRRLTHLVQEALNNKIVIIRRCLSCGTNVHVLCYEALLIKIEGVKKVVLLYLRE